MRALALSLSALSVAALTGGSGLTLTIPAWLLSVELWGCVALLLGLGLLVHPSVPAVEVALEPAEACDVVPAVAMPPAKELADPDRKQHTIDCWNPATGDYLGAVRVCSADEVKQRVHRAREAQKQWAGSSFAQRRQLLRIFNRCALDYADEICRVSARDSGKPMLDAAMGELITSLEKNAWLISEGEQWLQPEARSPGRMFFLKRAWVEWHPRGVLGAIVPWNYPFHNVLNPISAAVISGNAIVVKVSEHAAWSSLFYGRLIDACLAAAGAPPDLVQLVTGFAPTGEALTETCDKMTFVGSTKVGKLVMAHAAKTLTEVVLELGGKDPLVLLPGTHLPTVVPTCLRAAFQSSGQNCCGAERYLVHASLWDAFVAQAAEAARGMRQGPPLNADGNTGVDMGAMVLPGEARRIQRLIDEAVAAGATVAAGGALRPDHVDKSGAEGVPQFYPPTVLLLPALLSTPAQRKLELLREEVFGPVITAIRFETDDELVALANDCPFALGSNVFGDDAHVARVGKLIEGGMLACNDYATCYMCQSLPFGGLKESGFGKFAGVEGLRGCCLAKAVVQDRLSLFRTVMPDQVRYPVSDVAYPFFKSILGLFYGHSLGAKASALYTLLLCLVKPAAVKPKPAVATPQ